MNKSEAETAILVIDDEESLRSTFQFFLQNEGYSPVITASTYEEALAELNDRHFDLIISDIVLGGSTGIDLLRRVRELGRTCPVVMITGYPTVETASEAVRLGAFDYIPKPVEKQTLLKTARLALRQHQLEQGQRRAEQERERYRTFLETVFKSVADGIVTVDPDLAIMEMNPAARLLLGELDAGIAEQGSMLTLCGRDEFAPLKKDLLQVLKSGGEISARNFECQGAGRRKKMLSVSTAPLKDGAGGVAGAVMVVRDQTPVETGTVGRRQSFHRFLGASDAMQAVYTMIENVGRVDLTVLITGERHRQGTGGRGPAPGEPPPQEPHAGQGGLHRHPGVGPGGANCSATARARSPVRTGTGWAASSRRTAAPCSSTRSATSRRSCSRACCASCRRAPSTRWARTTPRR